MSFKQIFDSQDAVKLGTLVMSTPSNKAVAIKRTQHWKTHNSYVSPHCNV